METLGWPPNFVAKCPVYLFEAAEGSNAWLPSGAAGSLHMRPLGNAELYFQLRDLSDNQILFEHTMCKPDAFMVLSERFFVIRLENGSYRGFGFAEYAAACELKTLVEKAVKSHNLQENCEKSFTNNSASEKQTLTKCSPKRNDASSNSCKSAPKRSSAKPTQLSKEERVASAPSYEVVPFNPAMSNSSKWRFSWKGLTSFSYLKTWSLISEAFGLQEHEMEIGYPTDVKHVTHIGLDGPSIPSPSWIDELKSSPDFATGPMKESGQSNGSDWIHEAVSATKPNTPGLRDQSGPPPRPPTKFLDPGMAPTHVKRSKWSLSWLRHKSRAPAKNPLACQSYK